MKTQNNKLFIVVLVTFLVTITLLATTGCEKVQLNNEYWLADEDFVNGFGSEVQTVYVQEKDDLYICGALTSIAAHEKYGKGIEFVSSSDTTLTQAYFPLSVHRKDVQALVSCGDISPITLKKGKDNLYSKEDYVRLAFYPVTFTGYDTFHSALEKYDVEYDGSDIEKCRVYSVNGEKIDIYSSAKAPDGGTIYNIDSLEPGLYLINDTVGIIEIK